MPPADAVTALPDHVEALVRQAARPVAFDADGTLWRGDVGESLLRDLGADLFAEYERRVARDPIDAYTWAVEAMAGFDEAKLVARCERLFQNEEVFSFVPPLLARLDDVWIVSASPRWAVEAGARALGVGVDRVIAVTCPVRAGRLELPVERPIPCGPGKVAQLQKRGIRPALAFGDGALDEPMLAYAGAAVVVARRQGPDSPLVSAAARRGWPVLRT
jgi:phosphatidylglycerophosphatase C